MASATVEGCEYEKKSSTAIDVIDDGRGSRKSSPVIDDDGDIELESSGNSSPDTAAVDGSRRTSPVFDDGEIELDSTAAVDGNYSRFYLFQPLRFGVTDFEPRGREERRSNGQEGGNYSAEEFYNYRKALREIDLRMQTISLSPPLGGWPVYHCLSYFAPKGREEGSDGQEVGYRDRLLRGFVREGIGAFTPENESGIFQRVPTCLSTEHALRLSVTDLPRYPRDDTSRLPNGRFSEVEPGNWETGPSGHLIAGMPFGRGLAQLTPTSPDFRLEIMDHVVEPEVANPTSLMLEQPPPRSRFNQAMILLYAALELSGTASVIKYEESQMVAYFSMSTVCYLSAMYTAHLLAPLEGGNERFSVYLRGSSFVFLGLLRFLGVNQGSFVTALKIILGMSQVVLYWWTSGILQTYMNAFGMRRT